jgi:hypothetical protein
MNDLTMHSAVDAPPDLKRTFLERLVETGNVMAAAAQLGLPRTSVYYWKNRDPEFRRAWDLAMEVNRDSLREEVIETAKAIGLGRWVEVLDDDGQPVLDEDFEKVMRYETGHVDSRVLNKLLDKVLPSADEPATTSVNVSTTVNNELPQRPRLVRPAPVQTASAAQDVVDAEPITEQPGGHDA